ncbi:MAG: hypothetical protein HXS41_14785 [Theionarchaea archaeon]|nr:hypothetical protein [Theionarchaea archaeon]MBU7022317.1 hypothetical protein [Theionarchaea archaeon]
MNVNDAQCALLFPPLRYLDDAPFLTMFSGVIEKNVLVTYPLSLYERDSSGSLKWMGFLYAFLYTAKDGEKVCSLAHPLCFVKTSLGEEFEIYGRLFKEVEELARAFGVSRMEFEGYESIAGSVAAPLSSMVCGNTVNEEFSRFVKTKGFEERRVTLCYEIPVHPGEPEYSYTIADLNERRKTYLEFLEGSDSFPQHFSTDELLKNPPGIMDRLFLKEKWIVFCRQGKKEGCLRWIPCNGDTERAKVLRVIFRNADSDFFSAGMIDMVRVVASKGIRTVHVTDIMESSDLENVLQRMNGKPVYRSSLLQHRC